MTSTTFHSIVIQNCNCIKTASIQIANNCLNIKYGINGTGKSTLSTAIRAKGDGNKALLDSLLPYGVSNDQPDKCPYISNIPFTCIRVFDESYPHNFLFKNDSFFENSFRVFLQSEECDQLACETERLLSDLHGAFQQSPEIDQLKQLLPQFIAAVKFSSGKVSKAGGLGEFLKGNGCGFDKHKKLRPYQGYYKQDDFSRVTGWAKWRRDGIAHMRDTCPFCASDMDPSKIQEENTEILAVFKNSAINTASAVLDYLRKAVDINCIAEEEFKAFGSYIGDNSKSAALTTALTQLSAETYYLYNQINLMLNFKLMNVSREQVNNIEKKLNEMRIEDSLLPKFYCTDFAKTIFSEVNKKIDSMLEQAGRLKGLFKKYDDKLNKLINERKDDINHFFAIAGFPYEFQIEPIGNERVKTYLVPINTPSHTVANPADHLSWGERNAFSLVMFMFQALSEQADLIVLDDPITAFDENKKFAIIRRLFDNQKDSFRNKTVLLLTHDTQPLIDYVKLNVFDRFGLTTDVEVRYIENNDGFISEREIISDDLNNIVELTRSIASDTSESPVSRIVNLRKHLELICQDYRNAPAYHMLSNIVHGRCTPLGSDKQEMDQSSIDVGTLYITDYIKDFEYKKYVELLEDSQLKLRYRTAGPYEKVLLARFLFERKDLLTKLRRKYPALGKFLNESNHIENDYIFQLDPRKYLQIPPCYMGQLDEFITDEI